MNMADKGREERLLGRLMMAYRNKEYPYNQPGVQPPQRLITEEIKTNPRAHSFFLFVLCLWMRGGIESDTATQSLTRLYQIEPRLFEADYVQSFDQDQLEDLLSYVGLGFSRKVNAGFWISNAKLLAERWGGDPREIFRDFDVYPDEEKWRLAVSRIKNKGERGEKGGFGGFREKMTSMIIYYLMEERLISSFNFPVPVDFHVVRLIIIHRVYVLEEAVLYTGKPLDDLLEDVRMELFRYSERSDLTAIELCDALWLYSRSMCSKSPSFKAQPGERNGRSTEISSYVPRWTKAELASYLRTCGSCPVHDTCEHTVRSAYWYIQGRLHAENRHLPNQMNLFSSDDGHKLTSGICGCE